jgi:hypothetical protein
MVGPFMGNGGPASDRLARGQGVAVPWARGVSPSGAEGEG